MKGGLVVRNGRRGGWGRGEVAGKALSHLTDGDLMIFTFGFDVQLEQPPQGRWTRTILAAIAHGALLQVATSVC